jgi:hypothetical protein
MAHLGLTQISKKINEIKSSSQVYGCEMAASWGNTQLLGH